MTDNPQKLTAPEMMPQEPLSSKTWGKLQKEESTWGKLLGNEITWEQVSS